MLTDFGKSSDSEKRVVVGADDMLPVFVFVIANSAMRHPHTSLIHMRRLGSPKLLNTSAKYWLTAYESALYFISDLDLVELQSGASSSIDSSENSGGREDSVNTIDSLDIAELEIEGSFD